MTVDEIYEFLGSSLVDCLLEEWSSAQYDIEGDSTYAEPKASFIDKNNQKIDIDSEKIPHDVGFAIMDLHEITTNGGNNKWNRAIFKLWPNNDFNMEFIWDQELADKIKSNS